MNPADRRARFDDELSAAINGRPVRVHSGFGPEVDAALIAVALAHPTATGELIAKARRAFTADTTTADTTTADTTTADGAGAAAGEHDASNTR